jgi:hypothetical protein
MAQNVFVEAFVGHDNANNKKDWERMNPFWVVQGKFFASL